MDDAQIDRERHEVEAEWRAGFHAFRDGGQRRRPTARTMAGIAFDTGDERLDRRLVQPRRQLRNSAFRSRKLDRQFRVPALGRLQRAPQRADQRVFLSIR